MQITDKWKINKSADFSDIEEIDIHLEINKDGTAVALKDEEHTFLCKPVSSFKFLFIRYPFMIIPTTVLSLVFLWLHPIAFFLYLLLTMVVYTLAVRFCRIKSIGTYLMMFWVLHLLGNFFILGSGVLGSFSWAMTDKQQYIQSLFFGMLLTNIWIYVLIFLQQYYRVYNVVENDEDGEISTEWYIWNGCPLCNKTYNPFTDNCGGL